MIGPMDTETRNLLKSLASLAVLLALVVGTALVVIR